MRPFTASMD